MVTGKLPDHLSWSSISTYVQCSLKWRYHYMDRLEPEFTPSALVFGQAVHEAIGAFLESTLTGDRLSAANLADVYRQVWLSHDGPGVRFGSKETEDTLQKKAGALLSLFVDQYRGDTEVIAVEEPFAIDLQELWPEERCQLPLFVGVVDSIQKQNGSTFLIDYKTTARKPNGSVNVMQLVGYSMGAAGLGYDPDEMDYRYDYLVKTAQPSMVSCPVPVEEKDRRRFLKTVDRVWEAIQGSIFYPNPSYLCSSCGYQSRCNQW
jgi:putative RecB family exonuclease